MERLVDQIAMRAAELERRQEQLRREEARRARRARSPSRDRDRRGYYRHQPHQQHRSRTRSPPRARSPLRLWSGSAHPARIRAEERWMHTLLDTAQQAAAAQEAAQAFLNAARAVAVDEMPAWDGWADVLAQITPYPAVPMTIQRVANIERAQMLVESPSRAALQQFLTAWQDVLHSTRSLPQCKGLIRWAIDVDPLLI